jgi:late competence protein required for DNA uptake (superfamily II DNA/RNA helicase)
VQLGFYTAWSPALPLYAALAKRFPTCDIRIMYYESGMAFKGKLVYKNGKCTLNTSSNYRGSRGG